MNKKMSSHLGMMGWNGVQNTNFGVNQPRNWSITKPFNEFDNALVSILNQIGFSYAYNRKYNIVLINKDKITQVGIADRDENIILLTGDTKDIKYTDVIEGSRVVYGNYIGLIAIKLDPDAVIFSLSPKSMEKLQSKTLMPLRIPFDNNFVRLSNESLDVYLLSEGSYYKLSEEAGREVIALFNEQEGSNKGDE